MMKLMKWVILSQAGKVSRSMAPVALAIAASVCMAVPPVWRER